MSAYSPTSARKPPRQMPAWAFWTVVVVAIVFGILAGVLWFYLQSCRAAIVDPANSNCPTILPITCCKLDSGGNPLPQCTQACTTSADCTLPGHTTCTSSVCGPP